MPVKTEISEKLKTVLERHRDQVAFAYLFGSSLLDQVRPLSDVDIAVYLSDETEADYLWIKFALYADFSRVLKRNDVDVVILNGLTNLFLLEGIVKEGMVIFEEEGGEAIRKDFELKILHQVIDFKDQRKTIMGI